MTISLLSPNLLLLDNLFNGDGGTDLPHGSAVEISFGIDDDDEQEKDELTYEKDSDIVDEDIYEDESDSSNVIQKVTKGKIILDKIRSQFRYPSNLHKQRPFNWCQHLAGLYHPRNNGLNGGKTLYRVEPTTKSTIIRLSRRVRSHATLSAMLRVLMSKGIAYPIPVHPSMENQIAVEDTKNTILTKP